MSLLLKQVQSDARVKKVNEVVQGIRVIKLLAWEDAFVHIIEASRKKEIGYLIPQSCVKGLMGEPYWGLHGDLHRNTL